MVLVDRAGVGVEVDDHLSRGVVLAEFAGRCDDGAVLSRPRRALDLTVCVDVASQFGYVAGQGVRRRIVLERRLVGHESRACVFVHSDDTFIWLPVCPEHLVLTEINRLWLRRATRAKRDGDVDRGAEVALVDRDGGGVGREAVGNHLTHVRAHLHLRVSEGAVPRHVDDLPILLVGEGDERALRGRPEATGLERVGGLSLDLDREGRDLELGVGVDDFHLSGGGAVRAALPAGEGEDRGQERREEVLVHDLTPLKRSNWPVIF